MRGLVLGCVIFVGLTGLALAGAQESSSSSNGTARRPDAVNSQIGLKRADAAGSAVTLETNEALFDVATGLNACGYDADLEHSAPVRGEVRADVEAVIAVVPGAAKARQAMCAYMTEHELNDKGRSLAQYVSLAIYLGPAPALEPSAEQTDMPPDALAVVNVLPLLRTFAAATQLHAIWLKHHAEYQAITDKAHDPVTQVVLGTNIYLKAPVSSYDGRRLLILVEPMLAPNAPNARIYATDYVVVTSPNQAGTIRMDQIRHLYLHYEIEPLVYARAQSMARLEPLLKNVVDAPVDYVYKTDVVALVTECLIKAIEARTMETGLAVPVKPAGSKARVDLARYDEEMSSYDRQAEALRRRQVTLDMRQGWVLTNYFYGQMIEMEHSPESLSAIMGQMVYGMDVGREEHAAREIQFLPEGSGEYVKRSAPAATGLVLAEKKMMEGDLGGAEEIAEKTLADPKGDHGEALYLKARVELLEGDPESSSATFGEVVKHAENPRTVAWAHVYLGRLYDTKEPAERTEAVSEYKAALAVAGATPDAKAAAESGMKKAFAVPRTAVRHEEEELDPSGKKEKEAYKPE